MAEPVKDWTTDYDIFDPSYKKDPFPVWDEIRGKCPVAHTERWGGSFMPTRYEDLFNIARDIQHFSSRNVLVADVAPPPDGAEPGVEGITPYNVGAPPITSDPPGAHMGQEASAAAVLGERRRQVGARDARVVRLAHRRLHCEGARGRRR